MVLPQHSITHWLSSLGASQVIITGDYPDRLVAGMGSSVSELISKSCCYFYVVDEGFEGKCDVD